MEYQYPTNKIVTYSYYDVKLIQHHINAGETFDQEDVEGFDDMTTFIYQNELMAILDAKTAEDMAVRIEWIEAELIRNGFQKDVTILKDAIWQKECQSEMIGLQHPFLLLFAYENFFGTHQYLASVLTTTLGQRKTNESSSLDMKQQDQDQDEDLSQENKHLLFVLKLLMPI